MMGNKSPPCPTTTTTTTTATVSAAPSTLQSPVASSTQKSGGESSSNLLAVPSTLDPPPSAQPRPGKDAPSSALGNGIKKPVQMHCNGMAYSDDDVIEEVDEEAEAEAAAGGDGPVTSDVKDAGAVEQKEWKNKALEICQRMLGESFRKRLEKQTQIPPPGFGSKARLALQVSKAKKTVASSSSFIRRCNSVGAVGYAVVVRDERVPDNDFFRPDIRFRIRLRHSNLRCDDDGASCQREAAIKFADQNEDGPLDLILLTGRTSMGRNCNAFMDIMNLQKPDELKEACLRDPHFYFAFVDAMRRSPASYADLTYHSQITYLFIPKDEVHRLVRFRLVPGILCRHESGLLEDEEQEHPWQRSRSSNETRSRYFLRNEFMQRMEGFNAIRYQLQIQISNDLDYELWNPQLIWDDRKYPWIDLMKIQLTTIIPLSALCRTYFNIVDKPSCLRFIPPTSVYDYRSFQHVCSGMYTRFEIDHLQGTSWKDDEYLKKEVARRGKIQHYVTLCTVPVKDTKPRVDVFVTLIGTRGRTAPQRLDYHLEDDEEEDLLPTREGMEHFIINTEPVGEILAVEMAVRHRHITDEWYLRFVVLSDPERLRVQHFPCHSIVLSKVTLRPGEVSLPQKDCHELLRQERLLELRDRQTDYQWLETDDTMMIGQIKAQTVRELPVNEQLEGGKYSGMPWDVDPTTIETLLPVLASAAARGLFPSIPLFHRQTSNMGDNLPAMGPVRRQSHMRNRQSNLAARRRWRKIRFAIAFISKMKIPDGPKGDMCRSVQDDVDFGRFFLMGPNPVILRRISRIPDKLPVTDSMFEGYLNRGKTLEESAADGYVYLADYAILEDIPTIHRDTDIRFLVAPVVLFYVREFGDLIPLAIQLGQTPGPDTPIWTPRDTPEDWILAKLWVRCADFQYHFAITHLLKTHFVVEPFAIATMRQLSSSHPVYKLLKPHFRFTLVTNTLLRRHILRKGCALDKYTSIGSDGFRHLMSKYLKQFSFDELDLVKDLEGRGVDDPELLPNYFYRDDGLNLWSCISRYCTGVVSLFYSGNEDVQGDTELQAWIDEISCCGFGTLTPDQRQSLPLTSLSELAGLMTKLIFAMTCQHSATHTEALDLYGFIPGIPAMMRHPPMTRKKSVTKEVIVKTLPDQFPDAYYGSLATLMQVHRPEEQTLGESSEVYFVEPEARRITEAFQHDLHRLAREIKVRNKVTSIAYENLVPSWIPNSVEPLPFLPKLAKEEALSGSTPSSDPNASTHVFMMTPSVPLMILPICMYLARSMGASGGVSRQVSKSSGGFNQGVDGVGVRGEKISIQKNKFNSMF